jgi:hypothetical protein
MDTNTFPFKNNTNIVKHHFKILASLTMADRILKIKVHVQIEIIKELHILAAAGCCPNRLPVAVPPPKRLVPALVLVVPPKSPVLACCGCCPNVPKPDV